MKYSRLKHIFPCFLTICILLSISGLVSADNSIYVNTGESTLSQDLSEAYAIGSDGTMQLLGGDTAVITSSGIETISDVFVGASGDALDYVGNTSINITNDTVRVGLYYYYSSSRDSSVESCTVSNYTGSGFNFGYYDSNRNFVKLGSTTETSLLVMRDTTVSTSAGTVGAYHIKLSGSYSTYDEAKSAASKYTGGFPAYYSGAFYALIGNYSNTSTAQEALDALGVDGEVYTASSKAITVVKSGTTNVLFEFDYGTTQNLAISPVSSSGTKAVTTLTSGSTSYRYYGDFTFLRYKDLNMSVINYVNIEDYTKGVVPYEMTSSWPIEALKAQAVCARTYVATNFNQYGSVGFDVTNDTYSQVYRGTISANSTTDAAVDETAGLYVTYGGKLCSTFYFSSDGGATENSENVFYTALPYLIGKADPYEDEISFTYKTWDYSYTASEITAKLKAKGYSINTITDYEVEKTDVGNMKTLTFYDDYGNSVALTKTNLYGALGLPSINYDIEYNSSTGKYEIEGGGWGHNVGMSQWGAYSMAKIYGLNYADIICFYFTDVDISKGVY